MALRDTELTEQYIQNRSVDPTFGVIQVEPVEYDGTNLLRAQSTLMAVKLTVVDPITYMATAKIGTAQSAAAWQCKKIDETGGNMVITWADGNASFDNVATDLTALSYS